MNIKVERKITDITVGQLEIYDIIGGVDPQMVCGWIDPECPELLKVNKDGMYTNDPKYWLENAEVIITHESIHEAMCILGLAKIHHQWYDKKFGNIARSHFLMDSDPKWLVGKWEWSGKWIKKRFL